MFLYYITDRKQLVGMGNDTSDLLVAQIRAAANGGIDAIQVRENDLSARELVELGRRAVEVIREAGSPSAQNRRTRLLINSRIDVAVACGADGVHLRSNDISAADARAVFIHAGVAQPFIAVSCHTVEEVEWAEGNGADFAVFGPVFQKHGSNAAPVGLSALGDACQKHRATTLAMPVLALGGVDLENAGHCIRAGASGVAGIRLFQSGNVITTASRLRKLQS